MIRENGPQIKEMTPEAIEEAFADTKNNYETFKTHRMDFKKTMLTSLLRGIKKHESEIADALCGDLSLNANDSYLTNIFPVTSEIQECIDNIEKWSAPVSKKTPLMTYPSKAYVQNQPRGVVLILGAWNYPLATLSMIASAIAAGNAVIIKPSEISPRCSAVIAKVFGDHLDKRFYKIIQGGPETGKKLTSLPFSLICFTGSSMVGKFVAKAAAENLTPCVLELGGKCPAFVDSSANIEIAAKRIAFGKFGNAGQTCVAPDYVYVHPAIKGKFVERLKKEIDIMYGVNSKNSINYARLISIVHTERVASFLEGVEDKIIYGRKDDIEINGRYIPPILVEDPPNDSLLMTEEIFGPILPIVSYSKPQDVIKHINSLPQPLAVYYFGEQDSIIAQRLSEHTTSGSFVINDCVIQFVHPKLPFGGVGASGMGRLRGFTGFKTFSNERSILKRPNSSFLDMAVRYPSFTGDRRKAFKSLEWTYYWNLEDVLCTLLLIIMLCTLIAAYKYEVVQFNLPF